MLTKPEDKKYLPRLRFLQQGNECNYCRAVGGMTFGIPGRFRARLLWVRCLCGKSHLICFRCGDKVGALMRESRRFVAACAKGYYKTHHNGSADQHSEKGAKRDAETA